MRDFLCLRIEHHAIHVTYILASSRYDLGILFEFHF